MPEIAFSAVLVSAAFFGALLAFNLRHVRRSRSSRVRSLGWIMSGLYAAFLVAATQRLALQAVRAGWLPEGLREFLLSDWQVVQALAAMALGLLIFSAFSKIRQDLEGAERMIEILVDQIPANVSISELDLTARELEVMQVIGAGRLSDQEIADALYISAATAGTHVRNILRKAGLHRRNDLLLLVSREQTLA